MVPWKKFLLMWFSVTPMKKNSFKNGRSISNKIKKSSFPLASKLLTYGVKLEKKIEAYMTRYFRKSCLGQARQNHP
jgi:hypothetical protein